MYMAAGCYIMLHFYYIHSIQLELLMMPTPGCLESSPSIQYAQMCLCIFIYIYTAIYIHGYSRFHTCPDALQVLMMKSVRCQSSELAVSMSQTPRFHKQAVTHSAEASNQLTSKCFWHTRFMFFSLIAVALNASCCLLASIAKT